MRNNVYENLARIKNTDYRGKISSLTMIVEQNKTKKKIFKWLFNPNGIDFYIAFPYYKCEQFNCGILNIPPYTEKIDKFDAVKNATKSKIPVKFSYHRDGKVHFKPTSIDPKNKTYKLVEAKATPLTKLNGEHIFTIQFEGLHRFADYLGRRKTNGDIEVVLPAPNDVINFKILAYASTNEDDLNGRIDEKSPPWFVLSGGKLAGVPVFIGIYAILTKKSFIEDNNNSGLLAIVGFDTPRPTIEDKISSLYLFAR